MSIATLLLARIRAQDPAALASLVGRRVRFQRADGPTPVDTVREIGGTTRLLEPYARNEPVVCIVLTEHSWCEPKDVLEVLEL